MVPDSLQYDDGGTQVGRRLSREHVPRAQQLVVREGGARHDRGYTSEMKCG